MLRDELTEDVLDRLVHPGLRSVDDHLRMLRRLVRLRDPDQVLELSRKRFLVAAGTVPLDERLDRTLDEDFQETADLPARLVARFLVRAVDGGLEDDPAAARDQPASPGELAGLGIALVLRLGAPDAEKLLHLGPVQDLDSFP